MRGLLFICYEIVLLRPIDINIYISKEHFVFPFIFIHLIIFSVLVHLYLIPYRYVCIVFVIDDVDFGFVYLNY